MSPSWPPEPREGARGYSQVLTGPGGMEWGWGGVESPPKEGRVGGAVRQMSESPDGAPGAKSIVPSLAPPPHPCPPPTKDPGRFLRASDF